MARRGGLEGAARFIAAGFEFGGTIVAALLVGYYLDRLAGTAPLFTVVLLVGGFVGALRRLLWALKKNS